MSLKCNAFSSLFLIMTKENDIYALLENKTIMNENKSNLDKMFREVALDLIF